MKKRLLLIVMGATSMYAAAQEIPLDDFLEISLYSSKKLENYLSRQEYVSAGRFLQNDTVIDVWQQAIKPDSTRIPVARRFSRMLYQGDYGYEFRTTSRSEFMELLHRLRPAGFACVTTPNPDSILFFQQRNISIETQPVDEDSIRYYSMAMYRWKLPVAKNIRFADDLIQFTSHEYLVAFFGAANVKTDVFYFSDNEVNACTILFPNSPRQAIFIWNDEANRRGLAQILIGGGMRTGSGASFSRAISENTWSLRDGIQYNMKLEQLLAIHGTDLEFFGRPSRYFLMIKPGNSEVNNRIILDCINCAGSPLLDEKLISATQAVEEGLRLHVGMIVVLPELVVGSR